MKNFNEIYQYVYQESAEELNQIKSENNMRNLTFLIFEIGIGMVGFALKCYLIWWIIPLAFIIYMFLSIKRIKK